MQEQGDLGVDAFLEGRSVHLHVLLLPLLVCIGASSARHTYRSHLFLRDKNMCCREFLEMQCNHVYDHMI